MATYFATVQRHCSILGQDASFGIARPVTKKELAKIAVGVSGGGYDVGQVTGAMALQREMLAGEWSALLRNRVTNRIHRMAIARCTGPNTAAQGRVNATVASGGLCPVIV